MRVGVWIGYGKVQTFHEYRFLCIRESVIRKVENEFVGGQYWGSPTLLVIESGKFTNMSLFLFVKDFLKRTFNSSEDTL
jgi:hypothetical protein